MIRLSTISSLICVLIISGNVFGQEKKEIVRTVIGGAVVAQDDPCAFSESNTMVDIAIQTIISKNLDQVLLEETQGYTFNKLELLSYEPQGDACRYNYKIVYSDSDGYYSLVWVVDISKMLSSPNVNNRVNGENILESSGIIESALFETVSASKLTKVVQQ